jgi:hypothetical protein
MSIFRLVLGAGAWWVDKKLVLVIPANIYRSFRWAEVLHYCIP